MAKTAVAPPAPSVTSPPPSTKPEAEHLTWERLASENQRNDRLLAGLVVVLAFFMASFPVNNSDVWMHLKTGELIANGEFQFWESGNDPFSYNTGDLYWVHTSWLFDLFLFGMYSLFGGAGLAVFRAVVVAGLTVVLLLIRRPKSSLFISAFCAGLAMVVLTQRLFLRSELVTFVFLGLTLLFLWHPALKSPPEQLTWLFRLTQNRLWCLLPPLFALWANLDDRFLLGPALVLLYVLGEAVQETLSPRRLREDALDGSERRVLWIVLLAGIGACVLNPFHVYVFQLPGEWYSEAWSTLKGPFRFGLSPFEAQFFESRTGEAAWYRPLKLSLAEWAYYVLVLVGVGSFLLVRQHLNWWRVLVWGAFFGLSAWQVRNAGLFAVIAGPIAALNFQDWVRLHFGAKRSVERRQVAKGQIGRVTLLVAIVFLGAMTLQRAALQAFGQESGSASIHTRGGLGWSLAQDPSLELSSKQLEQWSREKQLPGNGFNLHLIEQPDYWAWFAPDNRSFIDSRFKLHSAATAKDFVAAYQALKETGKPKADPHGWQKVFREHRISHLVIGLYETVNLPDPSDPRGEKTTPVPLVMLLLEDGDQWEQLDYCDGRTFVLAWKKAVDPKEKTPLWDAKQLQALRFDAKREAFQTPRPERLPPPGGPPPPGEQSLFLSWLSGATARLPLSYTEGEWHYRRHQLEIQKKVYEAFVRQELTDILTRTPLHHPQLIHLLTQTPPPAFEPVSGANLILALRAARRSAAENPSHADTQHLLVRLYQALGQIEGAQPNRVREAQMLAALRRAAFLRPADPLFQRELAVVYLNKDYLDLAAKHYKLYQQALQNKGMAEPPPGVSSQDDVALQQDMQRMESRLRETQARYEGDRNAVPHYDLAHYARKMDPAAPRDGNRRCRLAQQAIYEYFEVFHQGQVQPGSPQASLVFMELAELLMDVGYVGDVHEHDYPSDNKLTEFFFPSDKEGHPFPHMTLRWIDAHLYLDIGGFRNDVLGLLLRPGLALPHVMVIQFHELVAQAAAANGDYERALAHLAAADDLRGVTAFRQMLAGSVLLDRGGNATASGPALEGIGLMNQAAAEARDRTGLLQQMGILALEAGWTRPAQPNAEESSLSAAELFEKAAANVERDSPLRILSERMYFQITGKELPAEPK